MKHNKLPNIPLLALAITVLASFAVKAAETNQTPVVRPMPYYFDNFDDSVIDTLKWDSILQFPPEMLPDVVEQNGSIQLKNGGELATNHFIKPSPDRPVQITARWTVDPNRSRDTDLFIFLRAQPGYTHESPHNWYNKPWSKIYVHLKADAHWNRIRADIVQDLRDSRNMSTVRHRIIEDTLIPEGSSTYEIEVVDDGTNISVTVTDAANPEQTDTLSGPVFVDPHAPYLVPYDSGRTVFSGALAMFPNDFLTDLIELDDIQISQSGSSSYTIIEDTPTQIPGFVVSDPDAADEEIEATLSVAHGSIDLVQTPLASTIEPSGRSLVLSGTQSAITHDLIAGILYTPDANYYGSDTLTITVDDIGNVGDGDDQETTETVALTIEAVEDLPIVGDDLYQVAENDDLVINAAMGILSNDSDGDNDPLTIELLTSPQHGSLSLAADGSFTYQHGGAEAAQDTFTYRLSDGKGHSLPATVTIQVAPINDIPQLGLEAGRVLTFDGLSEGVRIDNPPAMDGSFTVEFRASHIMGGFDWAFARGEPGEGKNIVLGWLTDGRFTMAFYPSGLNSPNPVPDIDWHHWAAVYDFDDTTGLGSRYLYLDGNLLGQDHNVPPVPATGPIYLGNWSEPTFEFPGAMDEVRIWSVARTQHEIQQDMDHPIVDQREGLEALYHFDEKGAWAVDSTGNERHGVLLHNDPDASRLSNGSWRGQREERTITLPGFDAEGASITYTVTSLPARGKLFQYPANTDTPLTPADLPVVVSDPSGRLVYRRDISTYSGGDFFGVTLNDGQIESSERTVWLDIDPSDVRVFLGDTLATGAPIDFGERGKADSGTVHTFILANVAHFSYLNVINPQISPGFSIDGAFPARVSPDATVNFSVRFDANTFGDHSGTLTFQTDDPDQPVVTMALEGSVEYPAVGVQQTGTPLTSGSGPAVDFGPRGSADGGTVLTFDLTNLAQFSNLTLSNPQTTSGFSIEGTFPSQVAPGITAPFSVRFDATSFGDHTGTLTFDTDDPDHPQFEIPLAGSVEHPDLDVFVDGISIVSGTGPEIYFGSRNSANDVFTKSIEIRNNSASPITLSDLVVPDNFSLVGEFPTSVAPNQSETFQIQFDAFRHGDHSALLQFQSNDPDEPIYRLTLTGTVALADIVIKHQGATIQGSLATRISFGRHPNGNPGVTKTIQIQNLSDLSPAILNNLSVPTGYTVAEAFPLEVAPGQTQDVNIEFVANNSGIYGGSITFDRASSSVAYEIPIIGSVPSSTTTVTTVDEWGFGSIRDAFAYGVTEGGTILFDSNLSGNMLLSSSIELPHDITIDGNGAAVRISTVASDSVISVPVGVTATLDSLTLFAESPATDGLLRNLGDLTVRNSTIRGNNAIRARGIRNAAKLLVENTEIKGTWDDAGGGIWSSAEDLQGEPVDQDGGGVSEAEWNAGGGTGHPAEVTLRDVAIRYCNGLGGGGGGVFQFGGTLAIVRGQYEHNGTTGAGGGILTQGTNVTISGGGTSVYNNSANPGVGGGLAIYSGDLTASDLYVTSNVAYSQGAGIFVDAKTDFVNLDRCQVNYNNRSHTAPNTTTAKGIGIYCRSSLRITNSAIHDNDSRTATSAEGVGVYVDLAAAPGDTDVTPHFFMGNSTVSGNRAPSATSLRGGGVHVRSISTSNNCRIESSTLVTNQSSGNSVGGLFASRSAIVVVESCIIAGNGNGYDVGWEGPAYFSSGGHNLIGDPGSTSTFDFSGNDMSFATLGGIGLANVLDTTLRDNGGQTLSHALIEGSPAIDAGDPSIQRYAYDQRGWGYVRILDGDGLNGARIDIGAFEKHAVPPIIVEEPESEPASEVVGRHIFYNNSAWDGNDPAANANDDAAIATDKSALLPGQTATFHNYTSYSSGINGVMIDITNLPGVPENADIHVRVGNNNDPSSWTTAYPPDITVRLGEGVNGSDRITLTWPDNHIEKQWLRIEIVANPTTGLNTSDVFYFGNAIGECGNSTSNAFVDVSDENASRQNPRNFLNLGPITDIYDYNRDRKVDISDQNIARNHNTNFLSALKLIDLTSTGSQGALTTQSVNRRPFAGELSGTGNGTENGESVGNGSVSTSVLQIHPLSDGWLLITTEYIGTGQYVLQTTDNVHTPRWETVPVNAARDSKSGELQWIVDSQAGQSMGFFRVVKSASSRASNL